MIRIGDSHRIHRTNARKYKSTHHARLAFDGVEAWSLAGVGLAQPPQDGRNAMSTPIFHQLEQWFRQEQP